MVSRRCVGIEKQDPRALAVVGAAFAVMAEYVVTVLSPGPAASAQAGAPATGSRDDDAPLLADKGQGSGIDDGESSSKVTALQLNAYGFLRCPVMMADTVYGPLFTIYTEVFGMSLEYMMVARIFAKSLDLILSFMIGHISDNLRTPFGRRKPFIFLAPPLAALGLLLLANPPEAFTAKAAAAKAAAAVGASASDSIMVDPCMGVPSTSGNGSCAPLRSCVAASINDGILTPWQFDPTAAAATSDDDAGGKGHAGVVSKSPVLVLWFVIFFMARFTLGNTVVAIPYDALGQELARTPEIQRALFQTKTVYAFMGVIGGTFLFKYAITVHPTALDKAVQLTSGISVIPLILGSWFLCCVIRERQPDGDAESGADGKPARPDGAFIPTIRDMIFRNAPYRFYIGMRLCVTSVVDLPHATRAFYIKYVLKAENMPAAMVSMSFANIFGAFFFLPVFSLLTKRFPIIKVFIATAALNAFVTFAIMCLPQHSVVYRYNLHLLWAAIVPIADVTGGFPMEMVLNGVIQYDTLVSGKSRTGMYVTMDAIIKQIVDMGAGLLPTAFLIVAGYVNNGGCTCGCATHCPLEYIRWSCPGDIGYACSDTMTAANEPFFGDASRIAPCTDQNLATYVTIHAFSLGIIFLLEVLFIRICLRYPITPEVRDEIAAANEKRKLHQKVVDPLTKREIDATVELDDSDREVRAWARGAPQGTREKGLSARHALSTKRRAKPSAHAAMPCPQHTHTPPRHRDVGTAMWFTCAPVAALCRTAPCPLRPLRGCPRPSVDVRSAVCVFCMCTLHVHVTGMCACDRCSTQ